MSIFLTSQASNVLEKIVLLLDKKPEDSKVIFVPTGAKPYAEAPWMDQDRDELVRLGFSVENLELDEASAEEVKRAVEAADIIFVAGGNTFYLLEHTKRTGFDVAAREAVSKGRVYIGSSAGSVLAAPDIKYVELFDEPSKASLEDTRGIGLVQFAVLPHAGNPKYKELQDKVMNEYKDWAYPLVLISNDEFVVPKGESWEIITVQL